MTSQWAFDCDNLRRVQILQDAKCNLLANGSQKNAQNKAHSCLKTICLGKWKEFHAKKTQKYLVNRNYRCFCPWNVVTQWRGLILVGAQKFSLQDCPKILWHLFEEDILLFLSVGKLWLKAIYQVVCQKSVKQVKLLKIRFSEAEFVTSSIFKRFLSNI